MFNFGDNVDRDTVDKVERAGDSRLSTNRRQIFVASVYRALPTVPGYHRWAGVFLVATDVGPSEVLSVRPSVCLSVCLSEWSDVLQARYLKFGTWVDCGKC